MTVVIVEEQRMFAEALATFLASQDDIDVMGTAFSAADALDLAIKYRPHVITTSYRLPDGNGADLTRMLRGERFEGRVIMVAELGHTDIIVAALDAGCSGFVPKSAPISDVATAAWTALSGEIAISPVLLTHLMQTLPRDPNELGTNLTAIELEILSLFPMGVPNRAMGDRLGLSERSIRNHVQSILTKLESHSKLEGLATAIRRGIIHLTLP